MTSQIVGRADLLNRKEAAAEAMRVLQKHNLEAPMSWVDSLFVDKVEVERKDGSLCWASKWIPSFETHRGNLAPGDKIEHGGSYSRFLYYKPKLEAAILRAYEENGPGRRAEFDLDEMLLPEGL